MALSSVHPLAAAKQALIDVIARSSSGLDVFYGRIPDQLARDRAVSVTGGAASVSPTFLGSGRDAFIESWSVTVMCMSAHMNHGPAEAEASALRLANTVVDAVTDNRTLKNTVEHAFTTSVAVAADLDGDPFVSRVDVVVEMVMKIS